jgi:hypothetical protein
LVHSTLVILPVSVISWLESYSAAKEWWAQVGVATNSKPTPASMIPRYPFLIKRTSPPYKDYIAGIVPRSNSEVKHRKIAYNECLERQHFAA